MSEPKLIKLTTIGNVGRFSVESTVTSLSCLDNAKWLGFLKTLAKSIKMLKDD